MYIQKDIEITKIEILDFLKQHKTELENKCLKDLKL